MGHNLENSIPDLSDHKRVVIVGGPRAGKTSFARKIAVEMEIPGFLIFDERLPFDNPPKWIIVTQHMYNIPGFLLNSATHIYAHIDGTFVLGS